ncbi:SDR family NAD(P)-dependent oxidoreductase [Marilutibacter chinensis]|uniref:SDR family oxidoreductase n=1 Tax=Marilutibacter chinensis TaxID=2912247 RepID=A0ABS9HY09_9GAMM|nr:SDR family oxidoreductase [Lysobacter chinensis]MCF7223678.1 SDR family oxidoreductase [Lysobacter chinensis]
MTGMVPVPMPSSLPVVVLGASGGIGRGVVRAALDRGRPVIAVARDPDALDTLRPLAPKSMLTLLPGSVADDVGGSQLAERLRRLDRPLAGVVACVCGRSQAGRLLNQPAEQLRQRLDEDLLPHLAAARHLLPLLAERGRNSTYVLIGGPGGEHPWAGYGHRSVAAAALRMLTRVLHDEARAQGVRVQLLTVDSPVRTSARRQQCCPQWPSALAVGQQALALVDRENPSAIPAPIVRYDGADRIDAPPAVETATAGSSESRTPDSIGRGTSSPHPRRQPQHRSQPDLLPEGCQQSARTLLMNLLTPPSSRTVAEPDPLASSSPSPQDKERPA